MFNGWKKKRAEKKLAKIEDALLELKGGKSFMARNLVREDKERQQEEDDGKKTRDMENAKTAVEDNKQPEIRVITSEQLIINNLEALLISQQEMFKKMIEGFNQVGVKFKD